jgi:hypothetical protein
MKRTKTGNTGRIQPCAVQAPCADTKAALLLAALTVSGGEPGSPEDPVDRVWYQQVLTAETGARRLALIVELGNGIYERISPLMPAVRAASTVDPSVDIAMGELVARRRDGMRRVIDLFAVRSELRPGLDPGLALDLLIGIHRWETFQAFTVECGWSLARYQAWQFATLARALLPTTVAERVLAPGSSEVADCSFAADLGLFR